MRILQGPTKITVQWGNARGFSFLGRGVLPIKTDLYTDAKAVRVLQRFEAALGCKTNARNEWCDCSKLEAALAGKPYSTCDAYRVTGSQEPFKN